MLKAQAPGTEPVFGGLAREAPADPCVAFILAEFAKAPPW